MILQSFLQRIAAGDSAAVRECIERYGPLVLAQARRLGLPEAQAEDAVQETFIDLWKHAHRFDPARAAESTFVTMIARRRLIDLRRRGASGVPTKPLEDLDFGTTDHDLSELEHADEAAVARRALAQLKPEEQKLIRMSIVAGLTHREIAASTGMPLGTVKSHLRRSLGRVRELLGASNRGSASEISS